MRTKIIAFFSIICLAVMLQMPSAWATEMSANQNQTENGSQEGGNSSDTQTVPETDGQDTEEQPPIEYKVVKVKDKIPLLAGETRYVSTSVPYDAELETSNPKVVLVANSGLILGKKAGTATVTMTSGDTKTIYTIVVKDTVDLIIFAGQSNMCGSGGNKAQAPMAKLGTAYEFDVLAKQPKCLIMKEPFGEGANRSQGLDDHKIYSASGTLVSAFCINYYKQTKTPVVGIPAAWGGSSTNTWLKRGLLDTTVSRIKKTKSYLKKNKVNIRHIYVVWYQGESDAMQGFGQKRHIQSMKQIYKKLKKVGVEQVMVIQIGHYMRDTLLNLDIMEAQVKLCKKDSHFTLVSKKAKSLYDSSGVNYSDSIHINQNGLNKIGYDAGTNAGKYAKKHSKK